jgi:hypothetical protein
VNSLALLTFTTWPLTANELLVPPTYEVGEIPDQRVIYDRAGSSLIFDVVASALGASPTITASYDETRKPDGALTFDTDLDRLSYSPAPTDTEPFEITFLAVGAGAPLVQQMTIEPVQPLPPEYESFGVKPDPATLPDPESRDYLVVDDRLTGNTLPFNEAEGVETRAVTIVGKVVVFEEGHPNDLHAVYHPKIKNQNREAQSERLKVTDLRFIEPSSSR